MTDQNKPSFVHALLTFLSIVGIVGFGLLHFEISLHILITICLVIAGISAWILTRKGFAPILLAMNNGIIKALSALYIFLLIGVLIAAFIQSGTVATLVYYGIKFISPSVFLPAGLLLCSVMSVLTGSSWSTVGTLGIVLLGIGEAMGLPIGIVAGVVISGATFGDKMSPMSDTTNLAAMSAGTDLYDHIKSMSITTFPTFLFVLVIFTFVGVQYTQPIPDGVLGEIASPLDAEFNLSLWCLLPLVLMLVLSIRRVPAIPSMVAASMLAVLLAIIQQGMNPISVLNALFEGGHFDTGNESLDRLLSRGGISSMMWTLSLALLVLALGGILHHFQFIQTLIEGILRKIKRVGSLVTTTIVSCMVGNITMGEAYMSIILGGQLFGAAYDQRGIDRKILSRSIEEGATLTVALIPWTTGGAFFATTLGVEVFEYAPWALLNWINPLVGIVVAYIWGQRLAK